MRISINWLKEFTDIKLSSEDLVTKIGSQLGEVEAVEDLSKKYKDIVVAKVISCNPHPNADRLKVCTIDDGGKNKKVKRTSAGLVQVICGAPNVKENMLVAWLPPGSTVPATYEREPLVLEARKIRGELSNGMLASGHELAINNDHDGILEVDQPAKPGELFADIYSLNDLIIDIENKMFTHRPDCFGLLGVAREVAGIQHIEFDSPQWYINSPSFESSDSLALKVENKLPELVPRFMAVAFDKITVKPSPIDIQIKLMKAGIKPINNIVDITNYMMFLTGQPLHAYDYEKVKKLSKSIPTLMTRKPKVSEKIRVLGGKIITPHKDAVMIATDTTAIGIGGVIGGADTEVDENTKSIILECANFDLYSVRRTSMTHGLFTDAVTRFSKGQSARQNDRVVFQTINMLNEAGAAQASAVIDDYKAKTNTPSVKVKTEFVNKILGSDLSSTSIKKLLKNVEFSVSGDASLEVTPPFWRTDVQIAEDVIEEVGRLEGYDNLPQVLPKRVITPSGVNADLALADKIRQILSELGANEVISYSFVPETLLNNCLQSPKQAFKIKNALSPELEYYRLSIIPSLLEKVHPNIKLGFKEFALFEIGRVHIKGKTDEEGLPEEFKRAAFVYSAKSSGQSSYFQAKNYLEKLLLELNVKNEIEFLPLEKSDSDQGAQYYEAGRAATIKAGGKIIGRIGEFKPEVSNALKLPEACAGFEIGLNDLSEMISASNDYQAISSFPSIDQDISLQTKFNLPYSEIYSALLTALDQNAADDIEIKISCIDIFSRDKKVKNTAFRIVASSSERTLTNEILNKILDKTAASLKKSISATRN